VRKPGPANAPTGEPGKPSIGMSGLPFSMIFHQQTWQTAYKHDTTSRQLDSS
jgi:hypothetical protein